MKNVAEPLHLVQRYPGGTHDEKLGKHTLTMAGMQSKVPKTSNLNIWFLGQGNPSKEATAHLRWKKKKREYREY